MRRQERRASNLFRFIYTHMRITMHAPSPDARLWGLGFRVQGSGFRVQGIANTHKRGLPPTPPRPCMYAYLCIHIWCMYRRTKPGCPPTPQQPWPVCTYTCMYVYLCVHMYTYACNLRPWPGRSWYMHVCVRTYTYVYVYVRVWMYK